jgi:hypothetical protein
MTTTMMANKIANKIKQQLFDGNGGGNIIPAATQNQQRGRTDRR